MSRVLMLFAALCIVGVSTATAAGQKGSRAGKVNVHAQQRGGGSANKGPRAKTGTHAGRPDSAGRPDGRARTGESIAERISRNPQQKARLEAMLPAGMTLDQAASGFRNQGQFIAALQASKNQNIPFDQLKAEMTGPNHSSLGQAIQKLKPADQKTETKS